MLQRFCRQIQAGLKNRLLFPLSARKRIPVLCSPLKMAHATVINGQHASSSTDSNNSTTKTSLTVRDEIRQKLRRLASLPAQIILAGLIYPVSLFWAAVVLACDSLVFLRSPTQYFKVQSRPYPDVLRPTTQQQHHRARLTNGITLHYVEQGDPQKPMILFLHGFPEFWYSWRHQLAALSQNYYCVAVDLRGYGDSSKPVEIDNYTTDKLVNDISLLIDHLGKQKCTVAAHDWGGVLAWAFAMAHPQKLERLVVMNCPHPSAYYQKFSLQQFLMSWYVFFFQLPWLPELFAWRRDLKSMDDLMQDAGLSTVELEAFKYTFSQPHAFTFPINYYRANVKRGLATTLGLSRFIFTGDEAAPGRRQQRRAENTSRKLPSSLPVLMIWGVHDKYLIKEQAERAGECCENYRCVYIEDAGHFVQHQKPNEVNNLVDQFMQNNDVKR